MGENIALAFQGIWAHKMRSFLTMLGVIIGIASIIAIVSTIQGTNEQIMQNLIGSGNNNVKVTLKQGEDDYWMDNGVPSNVTPISDEQKDSIRSLDDVKDASFYYYRSYADGISAGDNTLSMGAVYGVDDHYLSTTGYRLSSGRPFEASDFSQIRKVCMLDETAAASLFPDGNAVGSTIDVRGEPFTVVGLIEIDSSYQPTSLSDYYTYSQSQMGALLVPYTVWPVIYQFDEPQNCVVRAVDTQSMSSVGKEVEEIMRQSVQSTGDGSDSSDSITYKAEDLLEKAKNQQELASSTNNLLIWIASIALLVGGIGVMNIMLVSVTERTAEIGLKKAIGARQSAILGQFLTEAAVLTTMGGLIGVGVGVLLSYLINRFSGIPVAISIPWSAGAVLISMLIGVISGLLPAQKAARMDPINALRRE